VALQLYDTMTREEREFVPREEGKASIYVCGPTVYSDAHVGHGRASVVFDVLRRYLAWQGYDVTYVSNVTDVDDKIILRAARERTSPAASPPLHPRVEPHDGAHRGPRPGRAAVRDRPPARDASS
jgi:cysteinyl-tRNA synthetase